MVLNTDKFIYEKHVPLKEIDAIIEIKKPILRFNKMEEVITVIESKTIVCYLNQMV